MQITVKKATESEKLAMATQPTWECGSSDSIWYCDTETEWLIVNGEATLEYDGTSVNVGVGDFVTFPKGLSYNFKATNPFKHHYVSLH